MQIEVCSNFDCRGIYYYYGPYVLYDRAGYLSNQWNRSDKRGRDSVRTRERCRDAAACRNQSQICHTSEASGGALPGISSCFFRTTTSLPSAPTCTSSPSLSSMSEYLPLVVVHSVLTIYFSVIHGLTSSSECGTNTQTHTVLTSLTLMSSIAQLIQ